MSVTFTLTGFAPVKRDGIELTGSFVATINADLQVGSVAETITVSGQTPVVDVQSTQTQRVLNDEVIAALPTGRTPMSLATLIPGAVGFLGAQDVGGTDSLGAINGQFSIHGGSNNDMRVMTEGFYTGGNRSGLQFGNNQPNVGSTEEVSIDVAGNTAERAEGGILINFVPKSGGNTVQRIAVRLRDRQRAVGQQPDPAGEGPGLPDGRQGQEHLRHQPGVWRADQTRQAVVLHLGPVLWL